MFSMIDVNSWSTAQKSNSIFSCYEIKVYQELKVPSPETMTIEDRFPVDAGRGGEFLVRVHSKEIPRRVSVESPQGETPEPNAVSSEGGIRAPVLQTIRVQRWPTTSVSLRFPNSTSLFFIISRKKPDNWNFKNVYFGDI